MNSPTRRETLCFGLCLLGLVPSYIFNLFHEWEGNLPGSEPIALMYGLLIVPTLVTAFLLLFRGVEGFRSSQAFGLAVVAYLGPPLLMVAEGSQVAQVYGRGSILEFATVMFFLLSLWSVMAVRSFGWFQGWSNRTAEISLLRVAGIIALMAEINFPTWAMYVTGMILLWAYQPAIRFLCVALACLLAYAAIFLQLKAWTFSVGSVPWSHCSALAFGFWGSVAFMGALSHAPSEPAPRIQSRVERGEHLLSSWTRT